MYKTFNLTKNKFFEIQVEKREDARSWFYVNCGWSRKTDHAGFDFSLSVLRLFFSVSILDYRHWNYNEERWCNEGEVYECRSMPTKIECFLKEPVEWCEDLTYLEFFGRCLESTGGVLNFGDMERIESVFIRYLDPSIGKIDENNRVVEIDKDKFEQLWKWVVNYIIGCHIPTDYGKEKKS